MKIKSTIIVATLASVFSVSAQAAPIFSDDFEGYGAPDVLNWIPPAASGWEVIDGTVDLTKNDSGYFPPVSNGQGHFIDLDGSTGNSGFFANTNNISLLGGITYTLSFDLAGNQRGDVADIVTVTFGSASQDFSRNSSDPFQSFSLNFTPAGDALYQFGFQDNSNDNVGTLLDNVTIAAIPEPETYAMLLAGLGLMGFMARHRKESAV